MACARCGCSVYQTEDIITLNKIWHKCCFTCYRCNKRLDKCTARIFQGEVFCDCCYNCLLRELESLSAPPKPCHVSSSPSCTCEKEPVKPPKVLPPCAASKKYQICFMANQKRGSSKSCSCIPDQKPAAAKKELYCFAFPLPREVANYYNRVHSFAMSKPKRPATCCCPDAPRCRPKRPECPPPCLKIRSLSQQPPCSSCRSPPSILCCQCSPPSCCCCPQPTPRYPQSPPECCAAPPEPEKCCCPRCCPPPRCKAHTCPPRPSCPKPSRCSSTRKSCAPCCPEVGRKVVDCPKKEASWRWCLEKPPSCVCRPTPKPCPYGNPGPCCCKMCQVKAVCTPACTRCGHKVYAAEKISASRGAYHTSCFSCFCCRKLLDIKNFYESCEEIYCKQCYNSLHGNQFYGYGSSQLC